MKRSLKYLAVCVTVITLSALPILPTPTHAGGISLQSLASVIQTISTDLEVLTQNFHRLNTQQSFLRERISAIETFLNTPPAAAPATGTQPTPPPGSGGSTAPPPPVNPCIVTEWKGPMSGSGAKLHKMTIRLYNELFNHQLETMVVKNTKYYPHNQTTVILYEPIIPLAGHVKITETWRGCQYIEAEFYPQQR